MKSSKLVVAGFILLLALTMLFGGQVSSVQAQWYFPYTISSSSTNTQLQFYMENNMSSMGLLVKDEAGVEHHHSLSVYRLMNRYGAHFNLGVDYPGQNVSFKAFDPTRTDYRYTNWKPDAEGWFHWTPPVLNPGQQRHEFIGDAVKTVRLEFPATGYYKVAAELTQGQADPAGMLCDRLPCEPDGISAQALGMSLSFHAEAGQLLYFSTWSHNGEPGTVLITFNHADPPLTSHALRIAKTPVLGQAIFQLREHRETLTVNEYREGEFVITHHLPVYFEGFNYEAHINFDPTNIYPVRFELPEFGIEDIDWANSSWALRCDDRFQWTPMTVSVGFNAPVGLKAGEDITFRLQIDETGDYWAGSYSGEGPESPTMYLGDSVCPLELNGQAVNWSSKIGFFAEKGEVLFFSLTNEADDQILFDFRFEERFIERGRVILPMILHEVSLSPRPTDTPLPPPVVVTTTPAATDTPLPSPTF